jgi:hypothetical protein
MIRTGEEYRASIRDDREVYIDGERVKDVTVHPSFKPIVDVRARIYDMQHEPATRDVMTYEEDGERNAIGHKLPFEKQDWEDKRRAVNAVMNDIGGVVTRVSDETVGEMWSLWDPGRTPASPRLPATHSYSSSGIASIFPSSNSAVTTIAIRPVAASISRRVLRSLRSSMRIMPITMIF